MTPPSIRSCLARPVGPSSWGRVIFVGVATVVLLAVYVGCSPEKDYETLSFFFDGVPMPQWMLDQIEKEQQAAAVAQGLPEKPKPVTYFYHRPYADRSCFGCHDRTGGFSAPTGGKDLCVTCHDSYFKLEPDDWAHGPAYLGECRRCHEPHKSEFAGLLTVKQPDLCYTCHDKSFIQNDSMHSHLPQDVQCSACHDPHAAGNRLLLVDSRTIRRRTRDMKISRSAHNMWGQDTCEKCHDTQHANVLRQDVDKHCLDCHGDSIQAQSDTPGLHEAVKQGSCTVCHTPHKSSRPYLMRTSGEKVCYQCHKPQEIAPPKHPDVTRVDCLICHGGHRTEQPHLLRGDLGVAQRLLDFDRRPPEIKADTDKPNDEARPADEPGPTDDPSTQPLSVEPEGNTP